MAQIDKKASTETKALYTNLKKLAATGIMFGHQDALAYGLNKDSSRWIGIENKSDIKTLTGSHPAVIGHDLGHLEIDKMNNLDEVPFENIRQNIINTYLRGGLSTISWHPNNPLDLTKSTWDKMDQTIPKILNSKKNLKAYKKLLDKLAIFFKSLKAPGGEAVPILFRPYHEHTGSWFWWGADHCSPEEYKAFWRMTIDYFIKKKKLHNILYAYSTDNFKSEDHYLERFPGDTYADLLGFDTYHRNAPFGDSSFMANASRMVSTLKKLSNEKDKLYAITETGLERVVSKNWWTKIMLPIIQDSGLSYVLVWRNGRADHYYAPFEGQTSAEDFINFYHLPSTLFQKDLPSLYKPTN